MTGINTSVITAHGKAESSTSSKTANKHNVLAPKHVTWMEEKRKISAETAVRFGIYTGRSDQQTKMVVPDPGGSIIVFPFYERGKVVNEKYRGPDKAFWQREGGRRTFWNADVLDDPSLACYPLIITEGEPDALTAIECGYPFTVSVPDGAPSVPKGKQPNDLDPLDVAQESAGKFEFLWNNRDRLKKLTRFIIAVDNDEPGQRLAAELVRRLSAARCLFVVYPEGCKDLNDVLVKHGPDAVRLVLDGAKAYPVHGLYTIDDYPETAPLQTYSTGIPDLDPLLKPWLGAFMLVTGVPSHGKSSLVLNLLVNFYKLHGWCSAVYSPEMPTVPQLRDKLQNIIGGPDWREYIRHSMVFVDASQRDDEPDADLEWVLERAKDAVQRHGVKVLLIDPWNEIEHARRRDENTSDYVSRAIRRIKRFARAEGVLVIVVAHPTKDVFDKGKIRVPTPYDVESSAGWNNKADFCISVWRADAYKNECTVFVQKVRFDGTGRKGEALLEFNPRTCRYTSPAPLLEAFGT